MTKEQTPYQIEKQATTIILGSLKEMLSNADYCYISKSSPKYSELRDAGKSYTITLIESVLPLLIEAQQLKIKEEAEQRMLNQLSK
jgi:hypothetical protein